MMLEKRVYRYRNLEFWPENGYIYLVYVDRAEKADPKKIETIHKCFKGLEPEEFLKRAIIAGAFAYRYWENYRSEQKEVKEFLKNAREAYKRALEQKSSNGKKIQVASPIIYLSKNVEPKPAQEDGDKNAIENFLLYGFRLD